jgi:hypothetical protein
MPYAHVPYNRHSNKFEGGYHITMHFVPPGYTAGCKKISTVFISEFNALLNSIEITLQPLV